MLNDASDVSASSTPVNIVAAPSVGMSSRDVRLQRVLGKLPQLQEMTVQLFPGKLETEIAEDPELDDYKTLIFNVEAQGEFKEIHSRRLEWYEQTAELLGNDVDLITLSVHIP
jgi:hypothetical protein